MSNTSYQCTALHGTNKAGAVKADSNGYYKVVLGALNFYNSAGQYYPLNNEVEALFAESSILMRRVQTGNLRSEYGHPKFLPGMSKKDFLYRIMDIHEANVCCHIHELQIDKSSVKGKDGRPIVAIIGSIKPSGPRGDVLAAQLENPKENVCFSIRSITNDYIDSAGQTHKVLKEIYTWDYVNEPGISVANKWLSPALESVESFAFERKHLMLAKQLALATSNGMESGIVGSINSTLAKLGWDRPAETSTSGLLVPPSAKW